MRGLSGVRDRMRMIGKAADSDVPETGDTTQGNIKVTSLPVGSEAPMFEDGVAGRLAAFRSMATRAMEERDGTAALELIIQAHAGDVRALAAREHAATTAAQGAAADARIRHDLLQHVHSRVVREISTGARMHAHIQYLGHIVDEIRALVTQHSDEGHVPVEELRALIGAEIASLDFPPVIVATAVDHRYKLGTFATRDEVVRRSFAFVGWSSVVAGPTSGNAVEPTFLVDDRLLPASTIREAYDLRMEALT